MAGDIRASSHNHSGESRGARVLYRDCATCSDVIVDAIPSKPFLLARDNGKITRGEVHVIMKSYTYKYKCTCISIARRQMEVSNRGLSSLTVRKRPMLLLWNHILVVMIYVLERVHSHMKTGSVKVHTIG